MNRKYCGAFLHSIFLAVLVCILFSGCSSDISQEQLKIETISYTRDDFCPLSCEMYRAEVGGTEYYVQKEAYSEEDAEGVITEISSAEHKIRSEKELTQAAQTDGLKIFILDNVNEPTKESLIITRNSLETQDYRYDLFLKLTGYDRGNKSYGLCSYVFGDTSDDKGVKEFISRPEIMPFFDMFFLRGDSTIVGDESARQYLQMVADLSAYLIEEKGVDSFIADTMTPQDIEKWLLSMDIKPDLDETDICSLDDALVLNDPFYDVHIRLDRFDITADNYASLNTTVDEVASVLKLTRSFDAGIGQYLSLEGVLSQTSEWPVEVTLSTIGGSDHISNCVVREDKGTIIITLNNIAYATLAHEITHGYAGDVSEEKRWMNEGFAQYFSYIKFISPDLRDSFFEGLTSDSPDVVTREYYMSAKELPASSEDIDVSTCMNAYILQYWNGDEDMAKRSMFSDPIYSMYGNEKRFEGDELSYNEAMTFIAYLIDRFSFKDTWDCMVENKDYVEAFGFPYKKLKADWIESVTNP